MNPKGILPYSFYDRPVVQVARELLGKRLVRCWDDRRVSGIIIETEAYDGMQDLACHARVGKTKRNQVMFGKAGHAYVYFTYGMHWCLNVVTGEIGYPAAVLIRALTPIEGLEIIVQNRGKVERKNWTNGPAKLTQAFQINRQQNGIDLTGQKDHLWVEDGEEIADQFVQVGPRVGIDSTPEPWRSMPWRFQISDAPINLEE